MTPLKNIFFLLFLLFYTSSCRKLVDVQPPVTSSNAANVYTSDATSIAVLTGIYSGMGTLGSTFTGNASISLFCGLSADEFTLGSGISTASYTSYYKNALSAVSGTGSDFWSPLYRSVYNSNAAIEGLN